MAAWVNPYRHGQDIVETPEKEEKKASDWHAGNTRERTADAALRRACALIVSAVAAYASYIHQRAFALRGGADPTSAASWPLSVDGLLLLATVALLKPSRHSTRRARYTVWSAFLLGIAVSLATNIAAAPSLAWRPVLVAGWPPVALLLSVELLTHRASGARTDDGLLNPDDDIPDATDELPESEEDPLLQRARLADARHWREHQRPISAETLRKELRIGAGRARQLVTLVRSTTAPPAPRQGDTAGTASNSGDE
jgi:Protein of unknown function (DUF2637)